MLNARRLFLSILVVATACGSKDSTAPAGNTNTSGNTGGTGGSTSNAIAIADNSFTPSATTVPAGTTVTWTWTGFGTHNVTFNTAGVTGAGDRTSGTFSKQFATAGTFNYQCTNHPGMTGSIKVQ